MASPLATITFQVHADVALTFAHGWKLRAYSPTSPAWHLEHHKLKGSEHLRGALDEDLLLQRPLSFQSAELLTTPDRCALRLISRVYAVFGLSEDKIPAEFDRTRGVLVVPE